MDADEKIRELKLLENANRTVSFQRLNCYFVRTKTIKE
jgi:hypothetical protein